MQVRNKWLRILETLGGRSGNMTGAVPFRASQAADGASANAQSAYNSGATGSGRGRGRRRGGPRNRGNGRGGSRVVPRQPTPPAMVSQPLFITQAFTVTGVSLRFECQFQLHFVFKTD